MYEFTVDNTNTEVAKNIKYSLTNINNGFSNLKFKVYKGKQSNITSSSTSLMNSDTLTPSIKELELTGLGSTIKAKEEITKLSQQYGLYVDLDAIVDDITVGMQQRVEILKMLYRDNEILIFDEPTAVLTPQEIEELMKIMKNLMIWNFSY